MCSVVTNLVTSLEFQPIRCATTLFHFGRTRNVYVATRIILLSSTAESSATSGYVVAPELSGQSKLNSSEADMVTEPYPHTYVSIGDFVRSMIFPTIFFAPQEHSAKNFASMFFNCRYLCQFFQ